ncbi:putative SUR7/PalI family protein [Lyophyllum shimeji]|uniref:SUR7/PalI family protein n=1 Tax=Lyophyllum shimeji TaxID=47721 RepID=A0A9P3PKG2_LYOSH|nr:putative SUR7/PalI family protein [Lyophyllum shimeji]
MKDHHRPLARHRLVSAVSAIFLVGAFVLLLLVAVSLPILKPVYLLSVKSTVTGQPATSIATELRFGVWGVCASSVLDQPTWFTNDGWCYGPKLGYDIPSNITTLTGVSPLLVEAVEQSLLVILVLHPIAAGFSLIGFIFSFFLGPHGVAIIALVTTILAGIVGTIVLGIDLALVIIIRKKIIDEIPYHFEVDFGPGTWMVLAAVVMTWLAVIFLSARACYCCGVKRHYHHHHDSY